MRLPSTEIVLATAGEVWTLRKPRWTNDPVTVVVVLLDTLTV
jgi:hypothetical protein